MPVSDVSGMRLSGYFFQCGKGRGSPGNPGDISRKNNSRCRPLRSREIFFDQSAAGDVRMETGEISRKLKRGRHTTRHSQVIPVAESTYLVDTPGFSSLYLTDMEEQELKDYFREFQKYEEQCRFQGCRHIHEPGCAVKEALENQEISRLRYDNYLGLYEELKEKKRY